MRTATFIIAILAGCLGIGVVWLWLGSRILLVFDRWFPGSPSAKDTGQLMIDVGSFALGDRGWPLLGPGAIKLMLDSQCRIVLFTDGRAFTFGPVKTRWTDPVKPRYLFVPESGDVVSFTRDVSRLSWQTPFRVNFMGGTMPKRHRYVYDRLRWTKSYGAQLEITWRAQQDFFPSAGWQEDWNNRLTNFSIRIGAMEKAAASYLARTKGWNGDDYRLEARRDTPVDYVVEAVYLKDGGKSVVLRVNKSSNKVASETGVP